MVKIYIGTSPIGEILPRMMTTNQRSVLDSERSVSVSQECIRIIFYSKKFFKVYNIDKVLSCSDIWFYRQSQYYEF